MGRVLAVAGTCAHRTSPAHTAHAGDALGLVELASSAHLNTRPAGPAHFPSFLPVVDHSNRRPIAHIVPDRSCSRNYRNCCSPQAVDPVVRGLGYNIVAVAAAVAAAGSYRTDTPWRLRGEGGSSKPQTRYREPSDVFKKLRTGRAINGRRAKLKRQHRQELDEGGECCNEGKLGHSATAVAVAQVALRKFEDFGGW